jgi:hypothetical protein
VDPRALPLAPDSIDLVHSGGVLEHETPDRLRAFFAAELSRAQAGGWV